MNQPSNNVKMIFRESVPFIVRYRFFTENLEKNYFVPRRDSLHPLWSSAEVWQQEGVEKSTPKINSIIAAEITKNIFLN